MKLMLHGWRPGQKNSDINISGLAAPLSVGPFSLARPAKCKVLLGASDHGNDPAFDVAGANRYMKISVVGLNPAPGSATSASGPDRYLILPSTYKEVICPLPVPSAFTALDGRPSLGA